jgi:hypothetical protein
MKFLVLILALGTQAASANELAAFKESAAKILVEHTLISTEAGAFVCISIEGNAPDVAQMAFFEGLGTRDVGPPSACRCPKDAVGGCIHASSERPACLVGVDEFEFLSFSNASAWVVWSCGETNGGGVRASFEKRGEVWVYVGSREGIAI